jgi:hypothetical protein
MGFPVPLRSIATSRPLILSGAPVMQLDPTRALIAYSALLTLALVWTLLSGAAVPRAGVFDTIDVHRINVREADGTIRMIVASRDHFPGAIVHNREIPHPERADAAGVLFFNDEGTENGGLVFGGKKVNGSVTNFGHLSFDQYEQDQVINLEQVEEAGKRSGGLTIADYPDAALDFGLEGRLAKMSPAERQAEIERLRAAGALGHPRLFVGKSEARDAVLALKDGEGRVRLRMRVTLAGDASIEFLDAAGKVVRTEAP